MEAREPGTAGQRFLDRFRESYMAAMEAFNRGDIRAAYADAPEDLVFIPRPDIPEAGPLHGREAAIRWFEQIRMDLPEFRAEITGFEEPVPRVVLVTFVNRITGRASDLQLTGRTTVQAWDYRDRRLTISEHASREDAFAALGPSPGR